MIALAAAALLHLTYPSSSSLKAPVQVHFQQVCRELVVNFKVETPSLNTKQELGPNEYPFQFDVVEVFVSADGNPSSYYELELTPLGQTFEVKIKGPGETENNFDIGATYSSKIVKGGWVGQMRIPLDNLGWQGDQKKIIGNAFAVLGKRPNRSYWSLFLPPQVKPNFHKPKWFQPLL